MQCVLCIKHLPCRHHQLSWVHATSHIMHLIVNLHACLMVAVIHECQCWMPLTRVVRVLASTRLDLYGTGWLCWVWGRLQQQWPSASSTWCRSPVKQRPPCTSYAPSWRAVRCGAWPSPSTRPWMTSRYAHMNTCKPCASVLHLMTWQLSCLTWQSVYLNAKPGEKNWHALETHAWCVQQRHKL